MASGQSADIEITPLQRRRHNVASQQKLPAFGVTLIVTGHRHLSWMESPSSFLKPLGCTRHARCPVPVNAEDHRREAENRLIDNILLT